MFNWLLNSFPIVTSSANRKASVLIILLITIMGMAACSDNGSGPTNTEPGSGEISYESTNSDTTYTGNMSLSDIDICQDINPKKLNKNYDYFQNLDAACVISWTEDSKQFIFLAEPAAENHFNTLTLFFPKVSSTGELNLNNCSGSGSDCGIVYNGDFYVNSDGALNGDRQVALTSATLNISNTSNGRITGTFNGDGVLIFPGDDREIQEASASGSFDMPMN